MDKQHANLNEIIRCLYLFACCILVIIAAGCGEQSSTGYVTLGDKQHGEQRIPMYPDAFDERISEPDEAGRRAKFLYFKTTDSPSAVERFYRQALLVRGWEESMIQIADSSFSCCGSQQVFRVDIKTLPADAKLTQVVLAFTYRP